MNLLTKVAIGAALYYWLRPASPAAAADIAADAARLKTGLDDAAAKVKSAIAASGIELPPSVASGVNTAIDALASAAGHAGTIEAQFAAPTAPVVSIPQQAGVPASNSLHFYPVGQYSPSPT